MMSPGMFRDALERICSTGQAHLDQLANEYLVLYERVTELERHVTHMQSMGTQVVYDKRRLQTAFDDIVTDLRCYRGKVRVETVFQHLDLIKEVRHGADDRPQPPL